MAKISYLLFEKKSLDTQVFLTNVNMRREGWNACYKKRKKMGKTIICKALAKIEISI